MIEQAPRKRDRFRVEKRVVNGVEVDVKIFEADRRDEFAAHDSRYHIRADGKAHDGKREPIEALIAPIKGPRRYRRKTAANFNNLRRALGGR